MLQRRRAYAALFFIASLLMRCSLVNAVHTSTHPDTIHTLDDIIRLATVPQNVPDLPPSPTFPAFRHLLTQEHEPQQNIPTTYRSFLGGHSGTFQPHDVADASASHAVGRQHPPVNMQLELKHRETILAEGDKSVQPSYASASPATDPGTLLALGQPAWDKRGKGRPRKDERLLSEAERYKLMLNRERVGKYNEAKKAEREAYKRSVYAHFRSLPGAIDANWDQYWKRFEKPWHAKGEKANAKRKAAMQEANHKQYLKRVARDPGYYMDRYHLQRERRPPWYWKQGYIRERRRWFTEQAGLAERPPILRARRAVLTSPSTSGMLRATSEQEIVAHDEGSRESTPDYLQDEPYESPMRSSPARGDGDPGSHNHGEAL